MLDGVMLLWFVLAAIALLFVAIDIRTTPNLTCTMISKPYKTRWDFSEPYFIKEFRRVTPTF
jgi:hypothetical protein